MNMIAGAREAAGQKLWMDWDFFISWVYVEQSKKTITTEQQLWRKKQYAEQQL